MISGGCQCGAVRYRCESVSKASICHCRMCQKAFGGFYAPLVTSNNLQWNRGVPKYFKSSDKVTRGFCADCGTPLTYDWGGEVEIAIATLDDPTQAPPVTQVNITDKLDFVDQLHKLPVRQNSSGETSFMVDLQSYQHPDHDTDQWPQPNSMKSSI
ncbi:MAG: GFA family protein [Rhizobiaceae bacterium]|nr:GFA family protein [Rhizobiaceae bacterium]